MSESMIPPTVKSIGLSGRQGRKKQSLLTAARHNLRAIQAELGADSHIDAGRIYLNEILAGPDTPVGIDELAQAIRLRIGFIPKRKDYTQAHEFVFTLSSTTELDTTAFFRICLEFVAVEFGQENVLSAVVHRDEASPHCHILILPVAAGQYVGSELISKPSLAKLIEKFAVAVLDKFKVRVMEKLAGKVRSEITQAVLGRLESSLAPHVGGELLDVILKLAGRNPAPFMAALGVTLPAMDESTGDSGAEFRRIALSAGKGGKKERNQKPYGIGRTVFDGESKPYGIDIEGDCAIPKSRYQSCVVSAKLTPSFPPPNPSTEHDGQAHQELSDTPDEFGEVAAPTLRDPSVSQPAPALHQPSAISLSLVQRNDTPIISDAGQPGDVPDLDHQAQDEVDGDEGLHSTQNPTGLSKLGDTTGQDDAISNRLKFIEVANSRQAGASLSGRHLDDVTTRERDTEHEVGHWDPDRGEFVSTTATRAPHQIQPPTRGGRAAADNWVASEMAAKSTGSKVNNQYRH